MLQVCVCKGGLLLSGFVRERRDNCTVRCAYVHQSSPPAMRRQIHIYMRICAVYVRIRMCTYMQGSLGNVYAHAGPAAVKHALYSKRDRHEGVMDGDGIFQIHMRIFQIHMRIYL